MFYFTCNHLLSSAWVQHAKTLAESVLQYFCKWFSVTQFENILEVITCKIKH